MISIRSRNGRGICAKVIGGGDEEHLREVVGHSRKWSVKVRFCSGSSTSSSAAAGSPAVVGRELVDLVEQDDRVDRSGLLHGR